MILLQTLLASILLFTGPVWAEDIVSIADFSNDLSRPVPAGWQLKEKSGKADIAVVREEGLAAVRFRSAHSSFSLQKEVRVDLKQYPVLTWKWKVTKLPAGGDFRKSKTDDQAAQLFLAFSKTKAIVYIWDTTAPQGLMESTSPVPFMTVKVIVLESGPAGTGKWTVESRNVYEDYKKLFKAEPQTVNGIRLQINSQHTGTSAESYFADVAFKKQ